MLVSPQTQNATLERFKAGRLNTLVSTSVAEEGLDLKACQLVVSKCTLLLRVDPKQTWLNTFCIDP